jgi:alpha-tubulin suppressor-like RCC1 family protein
MLDSGEVYTWGRGLYGILGNGSNSYHLTPTLNDVLKDIYDEDPENN